ncbi:MAG: hypothetical protein JWO45_301, partial [Spartobacteria bacterium]|nr:hypothetical protein [Spartobacteria bacterium]
STNNDYPSCVTAYPRGLPLTRVQIFSVSDLEAPSEFGVGRSAFASSNSRFSAVRFEIRSLPALTHCFPRSFTFYVALPVRSIQLSVFTFQLLQTGSPHQPITTNG